MRLSYLKWIFSGVMIGAALVLAEALFLEQYFFQLKRYRIGKKNSDKRVRILLLTDLHFKKHFSLFHQHLARKINDINPDVIFISGDIIDLTGGPQPAKRFFNALKFDIPKFAIPGNHDVKNNVSRNTLKKIITQHNGYLLLNETKQITFNGIKLTVTGLDDFIESEGRFADAVKDAMKEDHHFLLVHSPAQYDVVLKELEAINKKRTFSNQVTIQYVFAGHIHGGQVRFKNIVPVKPKFSGNYLNGWYNDHQPSLYVSKGFGTTLYPIRFGSRSEVTLFNYGV